MHKLKAVCALWGDGAWIRAPTENNTGLTQVGIGGADKYTPVCRRCAGVYRDVPPARNLEAH
ncbi:MAG: hypothetical protein FWJ62_06500 [Thermaerobacter sp.]|nr:hypothetical protein [Bacillota bacterium]